MVWEILFDVSLSILYVGIVFKGYQFLARHLDKYSALKKENNRLTDKVEFLEGLVDFLQRRNGFLEQKIARQMTAHSTHQWR